MKNVTVNDVCNFVGGSQPPKSTFKYHPAEGYVRLIQTRDYKTDDFPTFIPIDSTSKFCGKSDIMIGRYGPPIFQICRGMEGAYNVALMKAVPKSNIRNDYLYYFLKQKALFEYIERLSLRTGGQTGVDLDCLKLYPIRLPSVEYQSKVENVLSVLDTKIKLNNRINEELEATAKLLYDYWFVQFDFPIPATQAIAMGKPNLEGRPYRASGGKMIYNPDLKREIPEGWVSGNLEMLGRIVGGSTPSTEAPQYFTTDGTPWVTPKDLSDNTENRFIDRGALDVTSEGIKAASLKLLPAGTVLMSSRAPIGYLAITRNPVTTNQGFKSFVPDKAFSSDYIYFTLKYFMKLIKANASGSTFKEISGGTLKAVRIHLPPDDLVAEFTDRVSSLSSQQSLLEQQNQQLSELRDWLLPMLMNGQVTVV
jgi:type I restriction enzyme, S subunit